jgi:hypothetical protein
MNHQKSERATYRNGIRDFWSFGQSETQKLICVPPLFCPETEFSSEVDLQNKMLFPTPLENMILWLSNLLVFNSGE